MSIENQKIVEIAESIKKVSLLINEMNTSGAYQLEDMSKAIQRVNERVTKLEENLTALTNARTPEMRYTVDQMPKPDDPPAIDSKRWRPSS